MTTKLLSPYLSYGLIVLGLAISVGGFYSDYLIHSQTGHVDHEPGLGPPAHNLTAIGLSTLGLGVASLGFAFLLGKDLRTRIGIAKYAALVLILGDGIVHLFALNEHLDFLLFAGFFLIVGLGQLALPLLTVRRDRLLAWAGIVASAALIVVFVYTRILPPPFHDDPEPVETLGIISKALEAGTIGLLAYLLPHQKAGYLRLSDNETHRVSNRPC